MDPQYIAQVAERTGCTHVHPGYGFLSESPQLASLFPPGGAVTFVGPSLETLQIASDKMQSRSLAIANGVPVAPGAHVSSADEVRKFVANLDTDAFPIVIKALDGGGGRGIRLVETAEEIDSAFRRCLGESASHRVFVEKAFVGSGWRHVEVQIIGDGRGNITHLWERECSVQRRFQKLIEMAPSTLPRDAVEPLIEAALRMARHLNYKSLGTFEFLVNSRSKDWIFLEINPRIQVEHTVTEEITGVDLVRAQLLLSLPYGTLQIALPAYSTSPPPPQGHAIQLRVVAEDPRSDFRLSTGIINPSDVIWPHGRGLRIDTWIATGPHPRGNLQCSVGVDFDSLLAKIIVHGGSFQEATARALRALSETYIKGDIKTNVHVLAGVIAHRDWSSGGSHTRWLEEKLGELVQLGTKQLPKADRDSTLVTAGAIRSTQETGSVTGTILLQPGASFQLTLTPSSEQSGSSSQAQRHSLVITSIGHNAFPNELSGTISTSLTPTPLSFSLTQLSSVPTSSQTEFANMADPSHVASPIAGKIVELHPALTAAAEDSNVHKRVVEGETLVVISVMKMESVVTAPRGGEVVRVGRGIKEGNIIGEGALLCMSFMDEIRKIPPVTRFLCGASLGVTLPVMLQIVSPYKVIFVKELVTRRYEVWRAFTSFFLGSSGINFIFDFVML
ncbi:hypothetical protein PYCCODRAFT_1356851 [Trametes coccinea BRFM310]|uniref:Carboxylase:pyruvate/acetyl-coa/propionyl-CoA n=1 Tax=Trametes coccinea (strain BRFM310) TaxID=1353009 RepID=A0A1Y2J8H0_TRAC3|nr:hypothetical protein PYCCODRAFT_1356851 [Trametes coccinea BRFM310]